MARVRFDLANVLDGILFVSLGEVRSLCPGDDHFSTTNIMTLDCSVTTDGKATHWVVKGSLAEVLEKLESSPREVDGPPYLYVSNCYCWVCNRNRSIGKIP